MVNAASTRVGKSSRFFQLLTFLSIFSVLLFGLTPAFAVTAPDPVQEVHVTSKTSTSVSLAWTPPASTQLPIADYLIEYLPTQGAWTKFNSPPITGTSATVTGLQFNLSYQFRVSVIQSDGQTSLPAIASYQILYSKTGRASGGAVYNCALTFDQTVQCWGDNSNFYGSLGMLGNGTSTSSQTPVLALAPEKLTSLSVGANSSCAIGLTQQVYCWGQNFGISAAGGSSLIPTLQPGLSKIVKVSTGNVGIYNDVMTACAIDVDNHGYCWGWGTVGQFGTGATGVFGLVGAAADPSKLVRASEPPGVGYVDVATSNLTTCFIGTNTRLYCTGDNNYSQLGIGLPTTPILVPTQVNLTSGDPLSGVQQVIFRHQIFVDQFTTCAVTTSANYCWGGSFYYPQVVETIPSYMFDSPNVSPWVSTLNVDAPANLSVSPTSGPVGSTVTINGDNLSAVTQVQFGSQNVAFSKNAGSLTFDVPTYASVGSTYSISVTSAGGSASLVNMFTVIQSPIVTINLTLTTDGQPLAGGSYTWLSQGRFSPSSPTLGDTTGLVTLTNVVSGPGQIIVTGAQLPDGRTVSGSWNVNLQSGPLALAANPPTAPPLVTASATVQFPNATPVPGAVLTASGLSGSYSDTNSYFALTYYLPSAITQGVSDVDGLAIIYGYQTASSILGTATFDDTVLKQSSQQFSLTPNGTASTIGLDYMPYLATDTSSLTANSGDVVSITFTNTNNTAPVANQDVVITETSVVSPTLAAASTIAAAAATCPTTFTGKTNSLGKVSIPLCTSVAGLHSYSISSVGAVKKFSTFTMNVSTQATATSFALTGPSSGIVNTTSKNFTITPDGAYTGTISIAVVGGGMNNTITRTFTNSAVPQTFTISPIDTGTVTLTATSSPALTNPAALTYTVNPAPATTYTLTGPSSGAVNTASSAFTITPNGVFTGTITITASGALSQTIAKTFSNSSAPQTFTITPTATGTVILAPTNSPSPGSSKLNNPTSLAYSVKLAGLTPTLTTSNNTSSGFTVNVTNYNANYTYAATSTAGTLTRGTASASTLPFVLSGLTSGQSATVTVTTTRTGYTNGQASITGTATGSYVISSISASPTSATVSTGYSALSTQSTVTLTRSGSSGQSPSATVSVTSGTWNVVSDNTTNLTTNNATVTSASSATLTLKNTTGSFKLSLVAGSGVGTYTATIASGAQSITYTVNVLASYTIASATASPTSASVGIASIPSLTGTISSTSTTTTITGLTSTSGLAVGMNLTKSGGAGSFGGASTIASIDSLTQITITSATANAAGSITFSASGYTATTQTTITLTRGGSSGSNPSTTLTVTSGTWSVVAGSGVSVSASTVGAGPGITVTLIAASGTFTLRLNNGATAATHSATLASVSPLTYSVTLGDLPTAVQSLSCLKGSRKGTVSCTWIAPTSPGSSALVRYEYRIKLSSATSWPTTWTSTNLTLSANISGLSAGAIYNVEVRAVNSFGAGLIATNSVTA